MSSTPGASAAAVAAADAHAGNSAASSALPDALIRSEVFAVVIVDRNARIAFANETFAAVLGYDSAGALIGRDFRQSCLAQDSGGAPWPAGDANQFRFRTAQGAPVVLSGEVCECGGDSAQRTLQYLLQRPVDTLDNGHGQLLEHAARMEAVAGLASGVAHDFNNLLTVLVGNLYLLGEELRDNESAFARIKAARDTALRGSELTRLLLNYARAEEGDESEVCPASVIRKLEPLLDKLLGSAIELRVDTSADGLTVSAGRAQLESAVVNLVINARDAIDAKGTVTVSVHESEAAARGQLIVSVADDGPGMPEAVRSRVFEPFFTTKDKGKGTGLGLSMVRWFVESAAGTVTVDSKPGAGTTVAMLLPLVGSQSGDTTCSKTQPLSVLPGGDERIALMIDDAEVRAMTQQTLAVLGYDVERVSSNGDWDDLDLSSFDLVLVDADESADVSDRIDELQCRCGVRAIALTAQTITELDGAFQLRKPFSLIELAGGVRTVLDGESAGV